MKGKIIQIRVSFLVCASTDEMNDSTVKGNYYFSEEYNLRKNILKIENCLNNSNSSGSLGLKEIQHNLS